MSQTTDPAFERIQMGSLVDEARRQIRRSILNGHLRPGERLRDSILAEEMGVSRSPVREALRLLEQAGLVEKTNNRSYRIPLFAPEDINELAALRAADEILAIRTIVTKRLPLDSLTEAIGAMAMAVAGGDPAKGLAADAAFHAEVVRLAGLPRLVERYDGLIDQIRLVLRANEVETWTHTPDIVEPHIRLLDAVRSAIDSGDSVQLIRKWEDHVLRGAAAPHVLDPL
ncbi:GntR family transcriptional regulator [Actinomadura madurae]|uniref:GntR family transcriptional regulator n=1 Tax=Actinomadura madurae TaxID=1993 RepID=UPI002025E622|nr:GntR family transcriptional regulator [Actinomadura madurae]MCP9953585.1 GntR family transcriptional regulator [Actinomadura madurae]MCP9970344.1 GntR family transcriptional regulator [Actinomadura madurae]MCP9982821.1 GntR family transcriptional regulator [Actinomadura madurae]MCQ0005630.1 GntR family transcriptional regulator [Actinomadura madurae]MCQ0019055.1 GntR family transcriptional regulator [Actinomadura madurae]